MTFERDPNAQVYLIFGANGWVGGMLYDLLRSKGKDVHGTAVRLEDREQVLAVLDSVKPTMVFNCAGKTGRPNVDWCEDNKEATLRSNAIGTMNLADCCFLKGIHMTNYATGCIYQYDETHKWHGKGFTEEDEPNFFGSFYSYSKGLVEKMLKTYTNVLTLRLRMPVSDDLSPRNFVTKISKYARVVDIPNSNSILHDLLPASIIMAENRVTGVYNFTNPGAISHNEVLTLYKKYIDPSFTWKNFSLEEQAQVIKAGRSNCELDSTKLLDAFKKLNIKIPEIHEAYELCFQRMAKNIKAEQDLNLSIATDVGSRVFDVNPDVKNILVTGGAGFIASYVVRKIVQLYPEYNVVNVDKVDYCSSLKNTGTLDGKPNYTFVKADITSTEEMVQIFRNHHIDTVLHLAAQTHVDNSFGNSAAFTYNNVMGTHILLEAAKAHKIKRFIHISTDEVYGEVEHGGLDLKENSLLAPTNPYAASKAAAEMLVAAYHKSFKLPAIITRSNNVYGPYQFPEKVIPKFTLLLSQGKKCCIHGSGGNTRRYIYGADVADAIDIILHRGVVGEAYNIGTTFEMSNIDLAKYLIKEIIPSAATSPEKYLEFFNDRPFNDLRYAVDSLRCSQLGWRPRFTFEEGIKKTIAWYTRYGPTWWGDVESILVPHPKAPTA
ncbi:RHM1/ROL1 [Blyttiomyces helicus]|uniref:RHM1/ROL1 n=1 Tax=Blyttiomyces helicus TaxID=388810 RepID=A0A4P9WKV4_9FUNG|nr:RHM1/ROL1 [Blyttiomyces helicus]|eukprot:RKO91246.1 RHM1/ROL1 [Blyttiomyces helicus]